jgi:hypothetical protein
MKELFLVEELENRLINEAIAYKHKFEEEWENVKFDPNYFNLFITGPLYTQFVADIFNKIKPLNNYEISKFLTLSVAQFKTHIPEIRENEFILNYLKASRFPNEMGSDVNEHDQKYAKHILKHYSNHFHLFKEATEKAFDDFKNGLYGESNKVQIINSEKRVEDFFYEVKEGHITQIEILNQVQKLTENFDLAKLEILSEDFSFFLFQEKGKKRSEFNDEVIANAIQQLKEKGKEIPYKFTAEIRTNKGEIIEEQHKFLDVEKLLFPFDFFLCYQFENFLTKEIDKQKEKISVPNVEKKEITKSTKPTPTFDNLLNAKNATFILKMLEDLSITKDGKSILSVRRKGALRGIVEASIENNILPQMSIDSLCKLIAEKIGLQLTSKLDFSDISKNTKKKAEQYINSNYKK